MTVNFTEDDNSLLVIVLDTNPYVWGKQSLRAENKQKSIDNNSFNQQNGHSQNIDGDSSVDTQIDFSTCLDHLFVFINAYLLLKQQNMLAVIASHPGESKFLYPKANAGNTSSGSDFEAIRKDITEQLSRLPTQSQDNPSVKLQVPAFSGALSLGLCYINRISKEVPQIKPRILVIQASPDVPSQYISVMNCIFSAQKKSILVDTCLLSATDSAFLQQASSITGGLYLKPTYQEGLLQYFLSCFLPDPYTRKFLNLPALTRVDFRASCFCHKKTIDIGFVCSVCLSIFCSFSPICSTCGAKFMLPKLAKLPVIKKKK